VTGARKRKKYQKARKILKNIALGVAFGALVLLFLFPFYVELWKDNPSADPFIRSLLQNFGFYYLEAISLSIVSLPFSYLFWKKRREYGRLIPIAVIIISILTIGLTFWLAPPQTYFMQGQNQVVGEWTSNAPINPVINASGMQAIYKFLYNASQSANTNPYLHQGWLIQSFFVYSEESSWLLGLCYGLVSVLVAYVGSRYRPKDRDTPRTLIEFTSMVSVIVSVMIFAASNIEVFSSVKYAFAVLPLLLAVLFFAAGMLAAPKEGQGIFSERTILYFLVSFAVGALFGSLIMPFTRMIYPGEPSPGGNVFQASPGMYFFMYSAMITVALLVIVAPYLFGRSGVNSRRRNQRS
jgi:hypothetical protein